MGWMLRSTKAAVLYFATVLAMSLALSAQENSSATSPSPLGGPQDWSNRHVIYTRNASLDDMLKLRNDPRFMSSIVLHYMREHPNQRVPSATALLNGAEEENVLNEETVNDDSDFRPLELWGPKSRPTRKNKNSKVDWAVPLGATAGMAIGETPSVYTANYTSPSCTNDFIVYTIGANAKTGTQANLIGLNNLYSDGAGTGFCTGSGPSFLFSYAIGSGPSVLSPVLSLDGTKIAWFENSTKAPTNNHAILHITTWVAGEGTSATTGAVAVDVENGTCTSGKSCDVSFDYTNSSYSGCTGTAIKADTNTHSDLYVDYATDTGYFSADNGILYHMKGIFKGTPTIDFCIAVNTAATNNGAGMSGAVYDEELTPAEVFISDSQTLYAYTVVQSVGALTGSYTLKASHPYGANGDITGPGPLLDAFNNFIYVFSAHDASNNNASVTQFPTSLASAVEVPLGPVTSFSDQVLFYGAFDNNYYNYGPAYGSHPASTLYSCGTDSTNKNTQDLFAIGFNSSTGIANTTPAMSYNKNSNPGAGNGLCSPITEFYDGTTDRIFVGMGDPGKNDGANVVTMWNVTTQLTNTSGTGGTMPTPVAEAVGYLGGTSGFAADNNASGTAQAENVYFSTEDADFSAVTGGYNVNGIYTDGTTFPKTGGLDDDGNAYSSNLLGSSVSWNGVTFALGAANAADAWQNTTINLPAGSFSSLEILATAVNGDLANQTFTVTYTDNSTTVITQSVSDWFTPQHYSGESIAATTAYRNVYNGTKDNRTFDLYGYTFSINSNKIVKSLTLPPVAVAPDNVVVVLAIALVPSCGGGDYCAVKLTQTGLQ